MVHLFHLHFIVTTCYNQPMKNLFKYTLDNKRYHTYNYFLKTKYHQKVAKVTLNADFTCPNRDGRLSYGGCAFLRLPKVREEYAGDVNDDLMTQFFSTVSNHAPEASRLRFYRYYSRLIQIPMPLFRCS